MIDEMMAACLMGIYFRTFSEKTNQKALNLLNLL